MLHEQEVDEVDESRVVGMTEAICAEAFFTIGDPPFLDQWSRARPPIRTSAIEPSPEGKAKGPDAPPRKLVVDAT